MEINADLLRQCRKNSRKAQYELYRMCFPTLMGVCSRYFQNDIDRRAMVNEGFLKIILSLNKYSTEIPFSAWIRKIMLNSIIDGYRKERKYREQTEHHDEPVLQVVSSVDSTLQKRYDADDLLAMIHQLPPMTKRVFNLFAIDGYSHFEVSALLGISEGTSKWHVATARKILADLIKKENALSTKLNNG